MTSQFKQSNIFESGFDSFELDDGFLMKIDSELKKNSLNEKHFDLPNKFKTDLKQENKGKKTSDIKSNYYDLPLYIEDFDESDFLDFSKNRKNKNSSRVVNSLKEEKEIKATCKGFTTCLSPILGPKVSKKLNLSSSTPIKSNDDSLSNEKPSTSQKIEKNPASNSEFDYLDADLFDDWDIDETNKKNSPKDTITFSQAMKLIEKAESVNQADEGCFNESLDLLTGEVIGANMGNMFDDSFNLPKVVEKKSEKKLSNNSKIAVDELKVVCKPAAAQKLNFSSEKIVIDNEDFFGSDDDFDFLTQESLKKPNVLSKYKKLNSKSPKVEKTKTLTPLKECSLNESSEDIIILKKSRRKCFNIIESDGTEDSPSPKFTRQSLARKRKNFQNLGKQFIESEADVSSEIKVSSDEAEEEGEYDKSFLDEESYFSQNRSADMTAKYLESVKTIKRHGSFKIPAPKPYIPDNIFSQIPEEGNTDYEIDSFCVPNDVGDDIYDKSDLSDLEVAEKILEMDRSKRKKKRTQKFRKFK